ncbi:MAG: hypothetical protein ACO3C1_05535 [Ilumatobacteraceae bacterium]
MAVPSSGSPAASPRGGAAVSLQVMADHVDRYHDQVGDLLPDFSTDEHGDVASALVEAERALRTAARLLRRASKLAAGQR